MALDGSGFHVEIEVLEGAAKAMGEITAKQDNFDLRGLCGEESEVGHATMHAALGNFCGKLSESMGILSDKAEDMRGGLETAARIYREHEHDTKQSLTADPAVEAMEDL
ncbi:hypothetical protein [Amycolatopsis anabasis]|uniref:hypothetical protein n=1 Tax=Amycolatopsis anabasis TaxID=1840409 RepID=UPI001FE8E710|nr:hypothetical protein [Amycolatopsis anabasis]